MARAQSAPGQLRLPVPQWRRELLYLAYAGMEICWVTPLFLVVNEPARRFAPYGTALVLAGLMLVNFFWSRLAEQFQLPLARERLVALVLLPLAILLGWRLYLHPGLSLLDLSWIQAAGYSLVLGTSGEHWAVMVAVLFLWWRGLALSRRVFTFESVSLGFRSGLLFLIFGTLLLSFLVEFQVTVFIFPFFFFSLFAIALSRLEEIGQLKGDVGRLFDLYWLAVLGTTVAVILGAGALLTIVASPEGIEALRHLWAPIGDALITLFTWLLGILLAPLEPLFRWLAELSAGIWAGLDEAGFLAGLENLELGIQQEQEPLATPYLSVAVQVIRLLCGGGIILAFIVAGLWLLNNERRRQRQLSEEHEALDVNLLDALAGLLRNTRNRLQGAVSLVGRFGVGSDLMAAISVRNIYANTVRLAARRGFPRNRARTPYEYLPDLQQAFPEAGAEAQALTDAYVGVHYGELPTTREGMAQLRAAYDRLRASSAPEKPPKGTGRN